MTEEKQFQDIAAVLNAAADLIEPQGVWGCKHCTATAIWSAYGETFGSDKTKPAQVVFANHVGVDANEIPYSIYRWNDAPERTQAEVVAKLREAAALASTDRELEA